MCSLPLSPNKQTRQILPLWLYLFQGSRAACCFSCCCFSQMVWMLLMWMQVQNVVEMPHNDELTLLEASRWGLEG